MTLDDWLVRLRMMARCSVVELKPSEVADMVTAIDGLKACAFQAQNAAIDLAQQVAAVEARPAPRCDRWYLVPCEETSGELFLVDGEPRFNVVRRHEAPFEHRGEAHPHRQAVLLVRKLNAGEAP